MAVRKYSCRSEKGPLAFWPHRKTSVPQEGEAGAPQQWGCWRLMAPAVFTHARHPGPREDEQGNFSGRSCKEKRYFLAVIAQLYDKKEKKPLCVCV